MNSPLKLEGVVSVILKLGVGFELALKSVGLILISWHKFSVGVGVSSKLIGFTQEGFSTSSAIRQVTSVSAL